MGVITNIQRFSVHDGPGIRTTVFFKGCNLRCAWCHNPETLEMRPQLQYFAHKCVLCGACGGACPHGLHRFEDGVHLFDRAECVSCGKCEAVCMYDAIKTAGREVSADDVVDIVKRDIAYYRNSGGGMTLSGGEPLLQPAFAAELLHKARALGIHTALDTAANVDFTVLEPMLSDISLVLLDLKCMDSDTHRRFTGVANDRILATARELLRSGVPVEVRIPVVSGVNDTIENAHAASVFLRSHGNVTRVKLLAYHAMGMDKAASLGQKQQEFAKPQHERLALLAGQFTQETIY